MHTDENLLDFDSFFQQLENKAGTVWNEILGKSQLIQAIEKGKITKAMYAIYMIETYHYTSHNARNQVMAGTRNDCSDVYTKFCYQHAAEEVGHEKLALHDLASIGLCDIKNAALSLQRPLLETESLIAYLYWISLTGNPLQRLGYSYWAESCYTYINPMVTKLRSALGLERSQMTFFIAHSDIDTQHFEDVKNVIRRTCKSQDDLNSIAYVMEVTLRMTGKMLDAVYGDYENLMAGKSSRSSFLSHL
ncbi:iron-containing redox enzyme family protein [Glaciimonas sp. PAMC28666]|uniref:iron-containing redox enzyme family protein n=1 Tax=Glaciimonas sp. PAMC28666 TaxID=2807626 RepID=UPI00196280BC|nr:iron-containing redox enzyme family protein [Glaciimonas sp. PAMC28666]QRX84055.1 iron-containing redox enzyme family protein [Glaciimonas sp. PAMC28666]